MSDLLLSLSDWWFRLRRGWSILFARSIGIEQTGGVVSAYIGDETDPVARRDLSGVWRYRCPLPDGTFYYMPCSLAVCEVLEARFIALEYRRKVRASR